ncbi:MAG TPA: hypothetical protein VL572_07015, partial [Pyrinomonadaceae bacterium]|nr:hypothetical protein [Pyrinomonadaceae bacterium]
NQCLPSAFGSFLSNFFVRLPYSLAYGAFAGRYVVCTTKLLATNVTNYTNNCMTFLIRLSDSR